MVAFKYRLDRILRIKCIDETQAVERLGVCQTACTRCDQTAQLLADEYEALLRQIACLDGGVSAAEYQLMARRLVVLAARLENLVAERERLDDELLASRTEVRDRVAERQAHNLLKQRAKARWRSGQRRLETKKMDAIGAASTWVDRKEGRDG